MKHLFRFIFLSSLAMSLVIGCKSTKTTSSSEVASAPAPTLSPAPTTSPPTISSAPQKDQIPFDPETRIGKLDNGLTYYIRKNAKPENRAELRLAVNAGSLLETDDQQGLAHFVEHMAFNGTKNYPKNELINYLESIGTKFGAHLNAYTSFDETVYMLRVPTDSSEIFHTGFQILEEWAHLVSFDAEEIDKERGVVVEEWRTRLGANNRMQEKTLPTMLYQSRYADRLPIGKVDILESFEHESLRQYYRDWYRPELMAVVAVGDFELDEVEAIIKEKFGRIPNSQNPKTRVLYNIPDHKETLITIASDEEASYNIIRVLYKHETQKTKTLQDYREGMIDALASSMLNGRFSELLQRENPPFTFASSGYGRLMRTKDNFGAIALVPQGGYLSGLQALLTENERAVRYGFTATELEREKRSILTNLEKQYKERDKTNSRDLINQYVQHYLSDRPVPGIENRLKLYQEFLPSISLEEVNARMNEYITEENRVVIMTGSSKNDAQMPSEAEVKAILDKVEKLDLAAYEDKISDAPLMATLPQTGSIASQNRVEALNMTEITFSNGLKVILKPTDFKNDEILMRAYSPGGHSLYSDEQFMSASMADAIIGQSGIGSFDNVQLEKYLSDKVVNLSPGISELSEGFRGSTSPEDVETLLQLVHLYFTEARKDPTAFTALISRMKGLYANYLDRPEAYFQNEVSKIITQNHLRSQFPTPELLDQVKLDDAYQIFRERFSNAGDFTFFFVGNFELETLVPLLTQYLGSLPDKNIKENWKDVEVNHPKGKIEKNIYKGKEPKSNVVLYFNGDYEWSLKENYQLNSMIHVLRIMLRESMRESKGGVYGVRASASPTKEPKERYSIRISFVCAPDNVDDLIATALKDIETLKKEGATAENLIKVKETQLKEYEEKLKENGYWMNYLYSTHLYQLDPLRYQNYSNRTAGLTSEDVKATANQYLKMDNFIKAVLYPEDASK